jgi:hypothetical protein
MSEPDTRIISAKELHELLEDQKFLRCLEDAGVDNWHGYEDAMEMYNTEAIDEVLNNG